MAAWRDITLEGKFRIPTRSCNILYLLTLVIILDVYISLVPTDTAPPNPFIHFLSKDNKSSFRRS